MSEAATKPANAKSEDRSDLLAKGRSFLSSPQVQHQDINAKRAFLIEKGLNDAEIEELLRAIPAQLPSIPPRTYPQLPPSNLPALLLGLVRLFSWLAGGSAVVLLLYHRLLLPWIAQTSLARHSLRSHHLSLLRRLTTSLAALKESQAESLSVLPRSSPLKELPRYAQCKSVSDAVAITGEKDSSFSTIPPLTLLRCGIADYGKGKDDQNAKPSTEDLFRYLESQIPWLVSEDGLHYEQKLWDTLSTCPLFNHDFSPTSTDLHNSADADLPTYWEYIPSTHESPPPLTKSLDALLYELPKDIKTRKSFFQRTLHFLSAFTGEISAQVYLPYRPPTAIGTGLSSSSEKSSIEDEMRREIRALKGLALNRRSFMPSIPRSTGNLV
ncbi:hypothetical protein BYT27DRAFT_7087553 [Phlegmacium glaucopus]|nr:hypothetical protein BYT27DRAFT_7087553 [Phlegmacium glaucopus]